MAVANEKGLALVSPPINYGREASFISSTEILRREEKQPGWLKTGL
jgi:hypothetical protein